jgi:hypothetical protein
MCSAPNKNPEIFVKFFYKFFYQLKKFFIFVSSVVSVSLTPPSLKGRESESLYKNFAKLTT